MYHAITSTETAEGQTYYGWTIYQDDDYLACAPDFPTAEERNASMLRHLGKWTNGELCSIDKMLFRVTPTNK